MVRNRPCWSPKISPCVMTIGLRPMSRLLLSYCVNNYSLRLQVQITVSYGFQAISGLKQPLERRTVSCILSGHPKSEVLLQSTLYIHHALAFRGRRAGSVCLFVIFLQSARARPIIIHRPLASATLEVDGRQLAKEVDEGVPRQSP
jgi:hypothetical protein